MLAGLLMTGMVCLLFACSEDPEQDLQEEETLQLFAYSQNYGNGESLGTRATSDYHFYTDAPITAYMTTIGEQPGAAKATFRYSATTTKWSSAFKIQEGETYYIYGFTPSSAVTGSSIDYLAGSSSYYANGAIMTLEGLEAVSDKDICLIVGVEQAESEQVAVSANFKPGSYKYEGKPKNQNFAYMLLHHFYGALSFTIKIDETYSQLRTIRLKKLELKDVPSSYSAAITLKPSDDKPIDNITYFKGEGNNNVTFFEHEGLELTTTAKVLTEPNSEEIKKMMVLPAPTNINSLVLLCTYDVYDRKGNLIREDCKVENKLPNGYITRGEWKTVNLTVNPTFLNVLSDPDLDNPPVLDYN